MHRPHAGRKRAYYDLQRGGQFFTVFLFAAQARERVAQRWSSDHAADDGRHDTRLRYQARKEPRTVRPALERTQRAGHAGRVGFDFAGREGEHRAAGAQMRGDGAQHADAPLAFGRHEDQLLARGGQRAQERPVGGHHAQVIARQAGKQRQCVGHARVVGQHQQRAFFRQAFVPGDGQRIDELAEDAFRAGLQAELFYAVVVILHLQRKTPAGKVQQAVQQPPSVADVTHAERLQEVIDIDESQIVNGGRIHMDIIEEMVTIQV